MFGLNSQSCGNFEIFNHTGWRRNRHGRADKGVLLRYIERMTGLSRQQVTRLVRQYRKDGKLSKQPRAPKRGFTCRYTAADVALLAEIDVLHSTLSGPATKKLMERGVTLKQMNAQAVEMSDNDAALALNNARKKLFKDIAAAMKKRA